MFWVVYKRCRLEEPQRLPLFIQDEFSVEVCCGIIRALQSFQTQVENFPLETSFKLKLKLRLSNLALFASNFGSSHALFSYFYGGWGPQMASGSKSWIILIFKSFCFADFQYGPIHRVVLCIWDS